MRRLFLVFVACLLCFDVLPASFGLAGDSEQSTENFPVREPDDESPLSVVFKALRFAVEMGSEEGFRAFEKLCLPGRVPDAEDEVELVRSEWEKLLTHGAAYLDSDLDGFKIFVIKMRPGPRWVKKKTKKVYVTVRNRIQPELNAGFFIVERDQKGAWKLRSLNL